MFLHILFIVITELLFALAADVIVRRWGKFRRRRNRIYQRLEIRPPLSFVPTKHVGKPARGATPMPKAKHAFRINFGQCDAEIQVHILIPPSAMPFVKSSERHEEATAD
jgi:hypothetical protein